MSMYGKEAGIASYSCSMDVVRIAGNCTSNNGACNSLYSNTNMPCVILLHCPSQGGHGSFME
jgi:hypothetical protein